MKEAQKQRVNVQNDQFILEIGLGTDEVPNPMETVIFTEDRVGCLDRIDAENVECSLIADLLRNRYKLLVWYRIPSTEWRTELVDEPCSWRELLVFKI